MASNTTLLEWIRRHTTVDCDTLNTDVAAELGPFEDCTSNQTILCTELLLPKHQNLIKESILLAKSIRSSFTLTLEELVIEIIALTIQRDMASRTQGYVHVQVNPFYAYSITKIIDNAHRYRKLCTYLKPQLPVFRLCIKVPSTWEGLSACRQLEAIGIRTLATTIFCLEQAACAADAGCLYIAPYVYELKVQVETAYEDNSPQFELCAIAQDYFERHGYQTRVMAASLTSTEDCIKLAGIHHITISETLLRLLAVQTEIEEVLKKGSIFGNRNLAGGSVTSPPFTERLSLLDSQENFRMEYTRSGRGTAESKTLQAINIFCDSQLQLLSMIREFDSHSG